MQESEFQKIRSDAALVRCHVLRAIRMAESGHLAGSLGMAEVFSFLYNHVLRVKPDQPAWPERDLLLLSAGHLCPVWYATLAVKGFFSVEELLQLRHFGAKLQGHPHRDTHAGIENTSGSLGQGISQAVGLALALQQKNSDRQVFVVSSDGEQNEGQVWEAYAFAAARHLRNLTVVVDVNGIQQSGQTAEVLDMGSLRDKWLSFGLTVAEADGHDPASLENAWENIKLVDRPKVLACRTTPGKGIDFMENKAFYHAGLPDEKGWARAFEQVEKELTAVGISLEEALGGAV
ncbi:transketolase [bacterium]|nr:transketolase [bacterium]